VHQRDAITRLWIAASCSGDAEALARLLTGFLPELRAFVRLRLGPELRARETSSDLVQSVCREVLADLDQFEYRGSPSFAPGCSGEHCTRSALGPTIGEPSAAIQNESSWPTTSGI
jgi:hypothetical protein